MSNMIINGVSYVSDHFEKIDLGNDRISLKAKNGVVIDFKKTANYENASVSYDDETKQITVTGFKNNNKKTTDPINITGTDNDDKIVIENSTLQNIDLKEGNDNLTLCDSKVENGNIISKIINFFKSIIHSSIIRTHDLVVDGSELKHNKYYTQGGEETDYIYFKDITLQNDTIFNDKCNFKVVSDAKMDTITAYIKNAFLHTIDK